MISYYICQSIHLPTYISIDLSIYVLIILIRMIEFRVRVKGVRGLRGLGLTL